MTEYARPGADGALMSFQSRYDNYIGGEWVAPTKGQYFENPTPVTGQTFCEVARSDASDVDACGLNVSHARLRRSAGPPGSASCQARSMSSPAR